MARKNNKYQISSMTMDEATYVTRLLSIYEIPCKILTSSVDPSRVNSISFSVKSENQADIKDVCQRFANRYEKTINSEVSKKTKQFINGYIYRIVDQVPAMAVSQ